MQPALVGEGEGEGVPCYCVLCYKSSQKGFRKCSERAIFPIADSIGGWAVDAKRHGSNPLKTSRADTVCR